MANHFAEQTAAAAMADIEPEFVEMEMEPTGISVSTQAFLSEVS